MPQPTHSARVTRLLVETAAIWIALLGTNIALALNGVGWAWHWALAVPQGLWMYRFYVVAHEASHGKLIRGSAILNDAVGSLCLLWLWAPLPVFRHIHDFHHGSNRRAAGIATLDVSRARGTLGRAAAKASWYLLVFCGGFFVHTLASILLFLFLPVRVGRKLSPAFLGWTPAKRARALCEFAASLALHGALVLAVGSDGWLRTMGAPMLALAWIWSLLLYVYHYRTTVGRQVRHNVRSLPHVPLFSWLLMNFNWHSPHHADPTIPWYDLPRAGDSRPEWMRERNQSVNSLWQAVKAQGGGPEFHAADARDHGDDERPSHEIRSA